MNFQPWCSSFGKFPLTTTGSGGEERRSSIPSNRRIRPISATKSAPSRNATPFGLCRSRATGTTRCVPRAVSPGRTAYTSPFRVPTKSVPFSPSVIDRALGTSAYVSIRNPGGSRIASRRVSGDRKAAPDRTVANAATKKIFPAVVRMPPPGSGRLPSAFHFPEKFLAPPFHLFRGDVFPVRGEVPRVPERVLDGSGPVAPEHVLHGPFHGRAGIHGFPERLVDVPDVEVDPRGRAAERLRRPAIHPGHFVAEEEPGIPDPEFRVHHGLSVQTVHPSEFLGTECPAVEVDGAIGSPHRQVRGDRVIPLRNRLYGQLHLPGFLHLPVSFPCPAGTPPDRPPLRGGILPR